MAKMILIIEDEVSIQNIIRAFLENAGYTVILADNGLEGIERFRASEAPVILADEPTGNLDEDTAREIIGILQESAHRMNRCVVVVTHSGELARQADVVLRLKKGVLVRESYS